MANVVPFSQVDGFVEFHAVDDCRSIPGMACGCIRFHFPNGYGASVVRHRGSYGGQDGLFELAVLDGGGNLTYSTPIASDVLGWLTEHDVIKEVAKIRALAPC